MAVSAIEFSIRRWNVHQNFDHLMGSLPEEVWPSNLQFVLRALDEEKGYDGMENDLRYKMTQCKFAFQDHEIDLHLQASSYDLLNQQHKCGSVAFKPT